jgi:hypothetical protein
MARSDFSRDLPTAMDPKDYRRGTLLGSLIVALGAFYAWNAIRVVVIDAGGSLLFVVFLTVMAGFVGGSGVLLMRRAKLGLWGLYCLSAYFVVLFLSGLVRNVILRSEDGAPKAIVEASLLLIWFSIVGYFFKRRRQFAKLWGGASTVVAQE